MNKILFGFMLFLMIVPVPAAARDNDRFLDIEVVTSPRGITAWLVRDETLPMVAMNFSFRDAGAAFDPVDKQGLAQMASNMMDEGAGEYDSQAFQRALANHSISLHFSSGRDYFGGSFQTLNHHADLAFELLRLALHEPRFDEEPLARMRASNIARIRSSLTDPQWMAARVMNDVAFAGHPYARNAGGTISSLQAITSDDLRAFVNTRLSRDRLVIGVAGDITPDELRRRLDQVFAPLPERAVPSAVPDIRIRGGGSVTLYPQDIPQTVISIIQPGIPHEDPEYHAAVVMNYILGASGFGSRLMEEIRERRGLTYGIYSSLWGLEHVDALSISASTANENVGEVIELVRAELRRLRDEPVTAAELADAQSYLIGSMPLTLSSVSNIAGMVRDLQLDRRSIDYLDRRAGLIEAVSADDIQAVARRLLEPDNLTVILVGQPRHIEPTRTMDALPNVE